MKILVANPNTSAGVTDRLVASGKLVATAGTELLPICYRLPVASAQARRRTAPPSP